MKAFDTDRSLRWLFCMTHPDDEIAIAGFLHRLASAGVEVHLSWTHSNATRRQEAFRAAQMLGIPQARLYCFEAPDGRVCESMPELIPLFRNLVDTVAPDRIVCGAFEQGHLDHDATNFVVNSVFGGPVFEVPLYHAYSRPIPTINDFAHPESAEVLELTLQEQRLKHALSHAYPSQRIRGNLVRYHAWRLATGRPVSLVKREKMRLQTHLDFRSPNLPEPLARRVRSCAKWRRWLNALDNVEVAGRPQ